MNRLAHMRAKVVNRIIPADQWAESMELPAEGDGIAGGLDLFSEAALELASVVCTDVEQGGNTNAVVRSDPLTASNPDSGPT
jgi:hypothetical protein